VTALVFVVPAYRRFELTRVCLTQLTRTCRELDAYDIRATAVVIADDQNLDVAAMLGFATVRRENKPLGRKFNDGIELACGHLGADYVVPIGTDNWVDAALIARLPEQDTIAAHRLCTLVHESGEKAGALNVAYDGGDGVRTWPRELLEPLRFRPAAEDRERAIDTSIRERMKLNGAKPAYVYHDLHPLQIVSFQSEDVQLNGYDELRSVFANGPERIDHWEALSEVYPEQAIEDVREVFARRRGLVAA
jgi:hypothetical protein